MMFSILILNEHIFKQEKKLKTKKKQKTKQKTYVIKVSIR